MKKVSWYFPLIKRNQKEEGINKSKDESVAFVISGLTQPNVEVSVKYSEILVIEAKKKSTKAVDKDKKVKKRLLKNCHIYKTPKRRGRTKKGYRKGKRISVIDYNKSWVLVFRKSGVGYLRKSCFTSKASYKTFFASNETQKNKLFQARSDVNGYFELFVTVPQGMIQIPVNLKSKTQGEQRMLISYEVHENLVVMLADGKVNPSFEGLSYYGQRNWSFNIGLNLGVDIQVYGQTIDGSSTEVSFTDTQGPSIGLNLDYIYKNFRASIIYMKADNLLDAIEGSLSVPDKNFPWNSVGFESGYNLSPHLSRMVLMESKVELHGLIAFEMMETPFLTLSPSELVSIYGVRSDYVKLGLLTRIQPSNQLEYDFKFYIRQPLSHSIYKLSSSVDNHTLKMPAKMGFELYGGLNYYISKSFYYGGNVNVKLNNSDYSYSNPGGTLTHDGERNYFDTQVNMMVGYKY
ncbi:MAG: hypothetical protein HOO06_07420 [Bdellovibrionaceae bacterium]|nr:hypothetical protein [Pseudobdellovibrionaceae bacterium]